MTSTRRALLDLLSRGERHTYGPGRHQVAELRLPDDAGPHPVAVVIHGGYWRARYSRRTTRPLAADLARRGWASWNIEYRRLGRGQGGGWPATFADVAAAFDLLFRVDAPLDLTRVVAIGHSAGGHLALWAASRPGLPMPAPGGPPALRLAAVVALAAVCDLEANPALLAPGEPVHRLMGGHPDDVDDRYAVANPRRLLPLGIPMLLVHGDADETVPVRRTRDFARAAEDAGDHVELLEEPGAGHRTMIDPRRAAWAAVTSWMARRAGPPADPAATLGERHNAG